jgi:hypothetical protein
LCSTQGRPVDLLNKEAKLFEGNKGPAQDEENPHAEIYRLFAIDAVDRRWKVPDPVEGDGKRYALATNGGARESRR